MVAINASRIIRFAINVNETFHENQAIPFDYENDMDEPREPSSDGLVTDSGVRAPVTIRTEEAVIISIIMSIWVGIILVFIKQWGKIRMLEPYQPSFVASPPGSPVIGVIGVCPKAKTTMTVTGVRLASCGQIRPGSLAKPGAVVAFPPFKRPAATDFRLSFPPDDDDAPAVVVVPCCQTCGQPRSGHESSNEQLAQPNSSSSSDRTMSAGSLTSSTNLIKNWRKYKSVEDMTLNVYQTKDSARSLLMS